MELDVHIMREADEPWGLEFEGGLDCGKPLTVFQVEPSSPAAAAGVRAGDYVTRVGDRLASELSIRDVWTYLDEAVGSVAFGLCRGLYDPVLDDFEGIYEPVERADSDLRSEPTEVSPPRCIDFPERPLSELLPDDFRPISQSRSLTASPFVPQTKPYRPFSTEPLNVPPLEEPIILNPKFKDDFTEIFEGIDIDKVETKFKLPVSQQYDPNYKKKVDRILEKSVERDVQRDETIECRVEEVRESKVQQSKVVGYSEVAQIKEIQNVTQLTEEEVRFDEQMKLDLDMVNIERTAIDVVDESIERAVSVTKEIQEAVEEELRASATRDIVEETTELKTEFLERKKSEVTKEVYKEEIQEESKQDVVKESKKSEMRICEENFEDVAEIPKELLYVRENKKKMKTHEVKTDMREFVKEDYEENVKESRKDEGKQKAFSIGLQTIPNIKGMAQSSYHFDLLMKTFFIHLTDVMVAMSRFILTQPALELEMKAERVIKDQLIVGLGREETVKRDVKSQESYKSQHTEKSNVEVKRESRASKENIEINKIEKRSELNTQEQLEFEEMERKRLSGAEMAQMTQRKPKELTHKMDAVISEFETKTGIEDSLEVREQRRSRSRSRIEEEVMKESDPLDWLSKVDSKQDKTSITKESHTESKKMRSEHESKEVRTSTTKPGKQMYVAVVESHVYTNRDAILQEMLETSSVESTEEMTEMRQSEKQQAVEVISQALESSVASSESKHQYLDIKESNVETASSTTEENYKTAAVKMTDVSLETSKELIETKVSKQEASEVKQELFTAVASETTETVEELESKSFKVAEVSEKKAIVSTEESYRETAIQSTETIIEESKETTDVKVSEKHATSKIEQLSIAIAESTDLVIDESKVETFEAEEITSKTAVVKEEESFKTAAIEISEVALEEAVEQHSLSIEKSHATVKETESLAVAGIIETKTQEDKVIIPKTEDEYAALKIIKQEIIEGPEEVTEIVENEVVKKSIEIENFVSEEKTLYQSEKLHIKTDIAQVLCQSSVVNDLNNNIDDTPSFVLPTPLTDEYVFKLQIPLPKNTVEVIDDSYDHEDLSIVKKKLIPYIETTVDETIVYDPPLPTPTEDKIEPVYTKPGLNGGCRPVYIKPGLRGGASVPCHRKEYIREIERKSSLLASAIDETIKSIEEYKEEVGMDRMEETVVEEDKEDEVTPEDELVGFRAVQFEPDSFPKQNTPVNVPVMPVLKTPDPYRDESGEPIGTVQGIVDGLEESTVDEEVAKELGKPGLTENKIAELISGESEMLREAHVMGLSRVLSSHMSKPDDSSVDFKKIKPLMESLKNSEVIAALNAELLKSKEEKKQEERKWTTFLQKPQRPSPRAKCGYYGFLPQEMNEQGPYKVKIVKQPKPKVAPDYKPEDFETGPLPWEQRALTEPVEPPPPLEDPILIPEEGPEFLEAVDPLTESEVPDLQDTGIILPPPKPDTPEAILEPEETPPVEEVVEEEPAEEKKEEEMKGEVEEMAEQLVQNVKSMVDPQAPIQQQLAQMRAQLAALAQLPCVIQQSLEMLTNHLANITQQESCQVISESQSQMKTETFEEVELTTSSVSQEQYQENEVGHVTIEEIGSPELNENIIQEVPEAKITLTAEEYAALKREEEMILEEQMKSEKLKKVQQRIEQESRQLKQRAPRVGKPKMFGPQEPEVRPLVLPGGRRWKGPKDVFNDQFIAETLQAQSEIIQGKVMGFESDRLPFDERFVISLCMLSAAATLDHNSLHSKRIENWNNIWPWQDSKSLCRQYRVNFMKYEKPPVSLDHLQNSDVYKAVHGMEQPMRRVDLLTPVVCEADYRERVRSMTPSTRVEEHLDIPQQLQP